MSDGKKSIPSWQQAAVTPPSSDAQQPPQDESSPSPDAPPAGFTGAVEDLALVGAEVDEMPSIPTREQAAKFLEHPGTQQASLEDKVRFLEVKHVRWEDIVALLPEAEKLRPKTTSIPSAAAASPPSSRDVPPVITYPEFLVHPQKPPPLVTTSFLLNTVYATAGAAAGMYALSKYFLAPMREQLTEARHDLFSDSAEKLVELNSRLGRLVSTAPKSILPELEARDDASVSSHDSDPTELYHRDIATQTTPGLSRRSSSILSVSDLPMSTLDSQQSRLSALAANVKTLNTSREQASGKEKDVKAQLDALGAYLSETMYSSAYYGFKSNPPTWSAGGSSATMDEFEKFKAEIRSVKGVMLSTRNFPRGHGHQAG